MILFHGGCHDCTQQDKHGTDFCFDCCYFNADWNKPSLNNKPPSPAEIERKKVIERREARNQRQAANKDPIAQAEAILRKEREATQKALARHSRPWWHW
jgi:hypothetical protein